jgi:hypothetical protein
MRVMTDGRECEAAIEAVRRSRPPLAVRWAGLAALVILTLAPPARADFGVAGRDSLAVPSLSSPALSAFT